MRASKRLHLAAVAGAATVGLVAGTLSALGPTPGGASSHREAPLISADPQVDTTDVYAFRSPDNPDTVTLVSSWLPFQEPAGGPNFYAWDDDAVYDLRIDNDGNARPDIIYRFDFADHYRNPNTFLYNTNQVTSLTDADLNFYQTYDVHKLTPKKHKKKGGKKDKAKKKKGGFKSTLLVDDAIAAPSHVGAASMPAYETDLFQPAVSPMAGGGLAWAGQSDDPFFLDLRVFDLLYGANLSEAGDETLEGFNVSTLAIQVPRNLVAGNGDVAANPIIGVWSTASRRSTRILKANGNEKHVGKLVQVSRLGMPLVNEVVVPVGNKDRWNASEPKDDGQFLQYVTDPELDKLIAAVYPGLFPNDPFPRPRNDLVQVFLTGIPNLNQPPGVTASEMIRLNLATELCGTGSAPVCNPEGVIGGDPQGYPNGRRLSDDTIDISLQVMEGELIGNPNDLGDGVDVNLEDPDFRPSFPYVALPTAGSDDDPH